MYDVPDPPVYARISGELRTNTGNDLRSFGKQPDANKVQVEECQAMLEHIVECSNDDRELRMQPSSSASPKEDIATNPKRAIIPYLTTTARPGNVVLDKDGYVVVPKNKGSTSKDGYEIPVLIMNETTTVLFEKEKTTDPEQADEKGKDSSSNSVEGLKNGDDEVFLPQQNDSNIENSIEDPRITEPNKENRPDIEHHCLEESSSSSSNKNRSDSTVSRLRYEKMEVPDLKKSTEKSRTDNTADRQIIEENPSSHDKKATKDLKKLTYEKTDSTDKSLTYNADENDLIHHVARSSSLPTATVRERPKVLPKPLMILPDCKRSSNNNNTSRLKFYENIEKMYDTAQPKHGKSQSCTPKRPMPLPRLMKSESVRC